MLRMSRDKSDKEIMRVIQEIMRQITSSITYLPCLDETSDSLELDQELCSPRILSNKDIKIKIYVLLVF